MLDMDSLDACKGNQAFLFLWFLFCFSFPFNFVTPYTSSARFLLAFGARIRPGVSPLQVEADYSKMDQRVSVDGYVGLEAGVVFR